MRRVFFVMAICVITALAQAAPWSGSGTYTVGTGGDYNTLGDFFFAMQGMRQGNGTAATDTTTSTLTGTGTSFTTQVQVGDYIWWYDGTNSVSRQVTSIVSDTALVMASNPPLNSTARLYEIYRAGSAAVTGNVTVEIISDITEPNCVPIIKDLAGFSLTIKPAATKTPTITFAKSLDNQGPSGRIVIGCGTLSFNELVNTVDNVTIDGSNNGSTSRDMTFVTNASFNYDTLVVCVGDNDNVVVKNMNLYHNNTQTAGTGTYHCRFVSRAVTAQLTLDPVSFAAVGTYIPDAWRVQNNIMKRTTTTPARSGAQQGIVSQNSGTVATGQFNWRIEDNYIASVTRGVFLDRGSIGDILRNKIIVEGRTGYDCFGILLNNAAAPAAPNTANYSDNFIYVACYEPTAAYGPSGMYVTSAGSGALVYNVKNNIIIARHRCAATANNVEIKGIYMTSYVTYNAYNNSVYLLSDNALTGLNAAGTINAAGMGGFGAGAYTADLKNNIVVTDLNPVPLIWRPNPGSGALTSNYNDLYGPVIGRSGVTDYTTLAGWQGLGYDANSKNLDPRVAIAPYSGKWYSASDLHFSTNAGPSWQYGTTGGGIPTLDIDQETRGTPPYVGADEPITSLYVASAYSDVNSPVPPIGYNPITLNSSVTASAPDIAVGADTKRVCTGWTGLGAVPASGSTNSITYTHDQDSTVTWSWKTQYQLATAVDPTTGGIVTPATTFFDSASVIPVQATPYYGYSFSAWSGDLSGSTNPDNVTMNAPKSVTANFLDLDINANPTVLNFGAVTVGSFGQLNVGVGNLGETALQVTNLSFTGTDAGVYSLTSPPSLPHTIDGGTTTTLAVRLTPSAAQTYNNANLVITSDDPDEPTLTVDLNGQGVAAPTPTPTATPTPSPTPPPTPTPSPSPTPTGIEAWEEYIN
jgi:hypothetical protein